MLVIGGNQSLGLFGQNFFKKLFGCWTSCSTHLFGWWRDGIATLKELALDLTNPPAAI
jgi:hypothetical protein